MKYRHLVQMPTAIKDWLEQQLESYGIDAVVYSRYILSLLQQETLDDPYDFLPQLASCKKEKRKGRKKSGHVPTNWHALDLDTLKRLAVVQCLMSAIDESCDVEKLVDDLCAKLKDIDNEEVGNVNKMLQTEEFEMDKSLLDPAAKYYAAFPPLVTNNKLSQSRTRYEPSCVWNKYILVDDDNVDLPGVNGLGLEFTTGADKCRERRDCPSNDDEGEDGRETKRLYERNVNENERDEHLQGLISKFDENIEALWRCDGVELVEGGGTGVCSYIQYGTNIETSIWSSEENVLNVRKWSETDMRAKKQDQEEEVGVVVVEEEDLLTSAKTHFRPIKSEEGKMSKTSVYADGTMFVIPNDWERVPFRRSDSGTLYLESDAELEAPKVYMEFKDLLADVSENVSMTDEFVPKFCVRQSNEKCCQTEDVEQEEQVVPTTDADEYVANINRKITTDPDEFYFPGDYELADELDEEQQQQHVLSDVNCNEMKQVESEDKRVCACKSGWSDDWTRTNWESDEKQWQEIWRNKQMVEGNGKSCPTCPSCHFHTTSLTMMRDELSEDGEQLMSDLSCLQQQYLYNQDEEERVSVKNDLHSFSKILLTNKLEESEKTWRMETTAGGFSDDDEDNNNTTTTPTTANSCVFKLKLAENDWEFKIFDAENKFVSAVIQKDRKRRHSSTQKVCKLYVEEQSLLSCWDQLHQQQTTPAFLRPLTL